MLNLDKVKLHAKSHVPFPATKAQLVQECDASEYSVEEKAEFAAKLPDGTYNAWEDVEKALGLSA